MSSLIQSLINAGDLIVWHAYDSGSLRDWSGNGFDGTGTAVEFKDSGGIAFEGATSEISVAYAAALQLFEATIIAEFNQLSRAMANDQRICERGSVAGTNNFDLYFNTDLGRLTLAASGVTTSLLNYDYRQTKILGINFLNAAQPECFSNGISLGLLATNITIGTNTSDLIIGNRTAGSRQLLNTLKSFLLINRKLTATEHSQIYGELSNLSWPSKTFGHRFSDLRPPKLDSSLWAGYRTRKLDELLIDESSNNYDLTANAGPTVIKTTIGDAIKFDGVGQFLTVAPNDTLTAATIEFWWAPRTGVTNSRRIIELGRNVLEIITNNLGSGISVVINGVGAYLENDGLVFDAFNHIVINYSNNSGGLVYINGTLSSTPIVTDQGVLGTFSDITIGSDQLLGLLTKGDIANICIYDEVKDATWVADRYILGARAVPFKTDWGITESVSNVTNGFITNSNIIAFTGSWSVGVEEINGVPAKVLTCESTGIVYIAQGHFHESEEQSSYGTWEYWMNKDTVGNYITSFGSEIDPLSLGNYRLQSSGTEDLTLIESGVAILATAATVVTPGIWQHIKITRDYLGEFNVYRDGTLILNGTSTTAISTKYFSIELATGSKICLGYINGDRAITKYLGVVGP